MLRRDLRALRRTAHAAGTAIAVPAGFDALLAMRGGTIAGYHAVGSEADPRALIDHARAAGWRVCYPHILSHARPMRFVLDDARPPVAGPFGLLQPPHDAADALPGVVLVPLLGFDAGFNRLGQGAGHYDRALAALPAALRIGVAFAAQETAALPVDPWDVPLDAIVTEAGLRLNPERRR